ncbi:hypothetical protein AVEN_174898-1 [Araneus ventricosus]|uniref:Uncharacterized protein n=1 Tax=Araneus ventricosus TaxID=182803 RepID=A0A4Y2J2R3_ARAVE|nr:hypothetical protein AVEN_174898-1 [Araneus ventricosus]
MASGAREIVGLFSTPDVINGFSSVNVNRIKGIIFIPIIFCLKEWHKRNNVLTPRRPQSSHTGHLYLPFPRVTTPLLSHDLDPKDLTETVIKAAEKKYVSSARMLAEIDVQDQGESYI